jgi:hypothetical protein
LDAELPQLMKNLPEDNKEKSHVNTNITTRFHITTRLRLVLRDFKVYTHERAMKQRGVRHESKNQTS